MFQTCAELAEGSEHKVAVLGGKEDGLTALDEHALGCVVVGCGCREPRHTETIGDEVFDGDEAKTVLLSDFLQLGKACHGAVF